MDIERYNIIWNEQSRNSGESMPVGGFDTGLNVWVENDEVLFYIDRSGSFDENNQMLKLGRVRLRLKPNIFAFDGCQFRQELILKEGYILISGKLPGGFEVKIIIWVEVLRPVIHMEVSSNEQIEIEVTYENWRISEREIPKNRRMSSMSTVGYMGRVVTESDKIEVIDQSVVFYHHNKKQKLFFDKVVEQQGLGEYKDLLWNPQKDLTFGGMLQGKKMSFVEKTEGVYSKIPFLGWKLKSNKPDFKHSIQISLNTSQTESIEQWGNQLKELSKEAKREKDSSLEIAQNWWKTFWQRSYIYIQPENKDEVSKPWQVGKNYNLFRFMLGCNALGSYPTKFNGGLFTSDPYYMVSKEYINETPDYRCWGGGSFTAQNQRLVYWPMLKSGDFELMLPQFDFYLRALPAAELRTKIYWGHKGCSFTEQLENFGLPTGLTWGWLGSDDVLHSRTEYSDPTEQLCPWIRYLYLSQLEFSFMIMKYFQYSEQDISKYLPFIESAIIFFDEHYQYRHFLNTGRKLDKAGKLVLFPSTACETYKDATNPTDLIAGLNATVTALLELPSGIINDEKREYYQGLLGRIPEMELREINGRNTISPAKHWTDIINHELPQLYPVFPYEQFQLGKKDLQLAIDTWKYGVDTESQKGYVSWHQDNIFCARLGLTQEASEYAVLKLEDSPRRFPAFWGPGHDWVPDFNHGGSGMIGLQDMLIQTYEHKIILFPAWPKEWDVDFKLHAPMNTIIECSYKKGIIEKLVVTPELRALDIEILV